MSTLLYQSTAGDRLHNMKFLLIFVPDFWVAKSVQMAFKS